MTPGTARSALGLLRERQWMNALLGVVALSVVFLLLGHWQLHRRHERDLRNTRVVENYAAAPVALGSVLPSPSTPLPAPAHWRPVRVAGEYLAGSTLLVRNRPLREQAGYEVLAALRIDSGGVLVVDRGWLPAGRTSAAPDTVPAAPSGQVQLLVRLRPGQDAGDRRAPPGQLPAIDLDRVAEQWHSPVYAGYGVLAEETPRPPTAPTLLPRPDVDPGPHLAYAVQWYGFAAAAYVMLTVLAVREVEQRGGAGTGGRPRLAAARTRRISDEEAEDDPA